MQKRGELVNHEPSSQISILLFKQHGLAAVCVYRIPKALVARKLIFINLLVLALFAPLLEKDDMFPVFHIVSLFSEPHHGCRIG
jgi:hypothetical protein